MNTMNSPSELDTLAQQDSGTRPLPIGHRMQEFEITGVLGIGGFGIVYRAQDHLLQRTVAIKEYMPAMLAERRGDLSIALRGERFAAPYRSGQAGFINEARLLAKFDHPGLIKVLRFWEANGTAYMVSPCYEGLTLKQRVAGGRALLEPEIMRLLASLLGVLETLHRGQCFHRDIALDNIMIQPDGSPVLLDFGAARKLIGDMVDDCTIMLKPGYAPIEQYTDDPAFRQGPWTDLYALGAVIHVLVCGELPPAAVVRSIQDQYVPLQQRALSYSPRLLHATDMALQQRIADRPQSVSAFAALLGLQSDAPGQYSVTEPLAASSARPAPRMQEPAPVGATPSLLTGAPAQAARAPRAAPPAAVPPAPAAPAADAALPAAPAKRRPRALVLGAALLVLAAGVGALALTLSGKREITPAAVVADVTAQAPAPAAAPTPAPAPPPPAAAISEPQPDVAAAATDPVPAAAASTDTASTASVDEVLAAPGASATATATATAAEPAKQPPRPAPAPKTVTVALNIKPWGALYVNGRERGVSPPLKTIQLAPGDYRIEVRNGTLPSYQLKLQVRAEAQDNAIVYDFQQGAK